MSEILQNQITREIELAYICRNCKKLSTKYYNIADIITKRLKRGKMIDINNVS